MSARTQTEEPSLVRFKNTDQLYSLKIAKGFYLTLKQDANIGISRDAVASFISIVRFAYF